MNPALNSGPDVGNAIVRICWGAGTGFQVTSRQKRRLFVPGRECLLADSMQGDRRELNCHVANLLFASSSGASHAVMALRQKASSTDFMAGQAHERRSRDHTSVHSKTRRPAGEARTSRVTRRVLSSIMSGSRHNYRRCWSLIPVGLLMGVTGRFRPLLFLNPPASGPQSVPCVVRRLWRAQRSGPFKNYWLLFLQVGETLAKRQCRPALVQ